MRPKVAKQMMSCSTTKLYGLINSGELETFMRGKAQYIPVMALEDYFTGQLSTNKAHRRLGAGDEPGCRWTHQMLRSAVPCRRAADRLLPCGARELHVVVSTQHNQPVGGCERAAYFP